MVNRVRMSRKKVPTGIGANLIYNRDNKVKAFDGRSTEEAHTSRDMTNNKPVAHGERGRRQLEGRKKLEARLQPMGKDL
jgi:hypothetical protein